MGARVNDVTRSGADGYVSGDGSDAVQASVCSDKGHIRKLSSRSSSEKMPGSHRTSPSMSLSSRSRSKPVVGNSSVLTFFGVLGESAGGNCLGGSLGAGGTVAVDE
eukprot:14173146-Alexandrium_andersonii.AAC.1